MELHRLGLATRVRTQEWVLKGAGCSLTLSSRPDLIKTIQTLYSIGKEANDLMNVTGMWMSYIHTTLILLHK